MNIKHNLSKHALFTVWGNIKSRCNNPDFPQFEDWGGRGIGICPEWENDFKVFYDWCMANGWRKGLEIDREENDGDYTPDNCRFITHRKNMLNQRMRKTNKSGYKGVCWSKHRKKWASKICVKGQRFYLGYYDDKKEAAKVRNNFIINNKLEHEYKVQEIK